MGVFKRNIEERVTYPENPRSGVRATKTAIKDEPFVFIPERVATRLPAIGGPDFQTVVAPDNSASVSADSLSEEPFKISKINLWQIFANLLKVEPGHIAEKFTHRLNHITPAERSGGSIKPRPQTLARKPFAPR